MVLAITFLIMFYFFTGCFAYVSCHTTLGWSKPWAVVGGIFWFVTGFFHLVFKLIKAMERDKCQK